MRIIAVSVLALLSSAFFHVALGAEVAPEVGNTVDGRSVRPALPVDPDPEPAAQVHGIPDAGLPDRTFELEPVLVEGGRRLEDIGVQRTKLDSVALRENITNSMAEVLSLNSSIFIKSYGRGTLATASFRGTAPSHTQVAWNGMKLNSPMLGMVDFSLIPSYFIDNASLYHGASAVGMTGGGLGGAVALGNMPVFENGWGVRYIQGISSFDTFDEFLRITYGSSRWQTSTRVSYVSSENDFEYTNYSKKVLVTDDQGRITDSYYGKARNRNGGFDDLHVLQEAYYDAGRGNRLSLAAWYTDSKRGVPTLNVVRQDDRYSKTQQDEHTLRGVLGWDRAYGNLDMSAKAGYTYTDMRYIYEAEKEAGSVERMIHSQSYVNSAFGRFDAEYRVGKRWLFSANVTAGQHSVDSRDRAAERYVRPGESKRIGYSKSRTELSAFAAVRYKPTDRLGLSVNLREDYYDKFTPLIPAAFAEYALTPKGNVLLKASVARNYHYPSLNDLYFQPGGNPDLRPERGFNYDGGVEVRLGDERIKFSGEAAGFDSYIDDWIVWLPTPKGFWSPSNVKKVHSYGLETRARFAADIKKDMRLMLNGNYTLTYAINHGDPMNWADGSIGKQLVYIPRHSAAVVGSLRWRTWEFAYKWNYYSERFTTSSNEKETSIGRLPAYFMSDISLEKRQDFKWAKVSLKIAVNNLFDEEYESVLSRPMAGRNFGLFIEIAPVFRKR